MDDVFKFGDEFEKKNKEFHIPKMWRQELANTPAFVRYYYIQLTAKEICEMIDVEIENKKGQIKVFKASRRRLLDEVVALAELKAEIEERFIEK